MVNEVEVEDPNAEPDKEYVYTIEHEVNVVNLSQSGCGAHKIEEKQPGIGTPRTNEQTAWDWDPRTHEQTAREWDPRTHESLVMVDSRSLCQRVSQVVSGTPNWNSLVMQLVSGEQTENRSRKYGKRQIWLKI